MPPPPAPMKQYVNFDAAHADARRQEGRSVPLRVTRVLWDGMMARFGTTPATRQLAWEVVARPGNIASNIVCTASPSAAAAAAAAAAFNDPLNAAYDATRDAAGDAARAAGATPAARKAARAAVPRPVLTTAPSRETKAAAPDAPALGHAITSEGADGQFQNTVTLPHTGGDTFTVRATKLDKKGKPTTTVVEVGEIVTWRRIYYDFYGANGFCHGLFQRIEDRLSEYYADAFIELVKNVSGDVADAPVTIVDLPTLLQGKAALDKTPCHLRLALVDQWGRKKAATIDLPAVDTQEGANLAATATTARNVGTGKWSFRVRLQPRTAFPDAGWLTSFRVLQETQPGVYGVIARDPTEMGPAHADVRHGNDDATVTIVSASLNAALTAAVRPCRVEIKCTYNQYLGGSSAGTNIAITRLALFGGDGTDDGDRLALVAFLHEIGHSLGMVDIVSPKFYFNDHGGNGPHCSTAAEILPPGTDRWTEIPRDATLSGQLFLPNAAGAGQCVMYHSRWTNMKDARFCPDCIATMKKMMISVKQPANP